MTIDTSHFTDISYNVYSIANVLTWTDAQFTTTESDTLCGIWTYSVLLGPAPGTALSTPPFTVDLLAKTLTTETTNELDIGTYPILITAWNADYPLVTVDYTFNVIISNPCAIATLSLGTPTLSSGQYILG